MSSFLNVVTVGDQINIYRGPVGYFPSLFSWIQRLCQSTATAHDNWKLSIWHSAYCSDGEGVCIPREACSESSNAPEKCLFCPLFCEFPCFSYIARWCSPSGKFHFYSHDISIASWQLYLEMCYNSVSICKQVP